MCLANGSSCAASDVTCLLNFPCRCNAFLWYYRTYQSPWKRGWHHCFSLARSSVNLHSLVISGASCLHNSQLCRGAKAPWLWYSQSHAWHIRRLFHAAANTSLAAVTRRWEFFDLSSKQFAQSPWQQSKPNRLPPQTICIQVSCSCLQNAQWVPLWKNGRTNLAFDSFSWLVSSHWPFEPEPRCDSVKCLAVHGSSCNYSCFSRPLTAYDVSYSCLISVESPDIWDAFLCKKFRPSDRVYLSDRQWLNRTVADDWQLIQR